MITYYWSIFVSYTSFWGVTVAEDKESALQNALNFAQALELTVLADNPDYDDFWYYGSIRWESLKELLEKSLVEVILGTTFGDYHSS